MCSSHAKYMNIFNTLRSELLEFAGEVAVAYPESWVTISALLGLATGVTIWGLLGFALGSVVGHAQFGLWCGLGFYSYWLAANAERINSNMDVVVDALKSLK